MPLLDEFDSIHALSCALHARRLSAQELAASALQAARDCNDPGLFLHIDETLTMAQAKAADALLAGDHAAALAGIPIAHKDLFATQGWRTTARSEEHTSELQSLMRISYAVFS